MNVHVTDYDLAAKKILEIVGHNIVIGVPLGLGKPIGILNALYKLALNDSSIHLTILTGLTFARPQLKEGLEKQFIEPILNRTLGSFEDPLYEKARLKQTLPSNINVIEFFLSPGKFLHNAYVQQHYISSSYTSVVRDISHLSINVLAQAVAINPNRKDFYSLSCNTDLFHGTLDYLKQSLNDGKKVAVVAEVNANLPYMYGDMAEVSNDTFSVVVDTKQYRSLFAVPRAAIANQDHLIGLYASCLIKDDGCLQVGIGELSNALAYSLILRHKNNAAYKEALNNCHVLDRFQTSINDAGSIEPFSAGLYSSTEMFSDEFLQLYNAGILKKKVYDHAGLQYLLNANKITETINFDFIQELLTHEIINKKLTQKDFNFLQRFGVINTQIQFNNGMLVLPNGETLSAEISSIDPSTLMTLLGKTLIGGKLVHAGFFFGSVDFYAQLKNLPLEAIQQIEMTSIARTNSLLWNPALLTLQRKNARFANSSLMVTLLGTVISDGLENYQVISGVGGQFDFVNMADQLEDGRSIIFCRSTRESKEGLKSNIIWEYSNTTIPRYLRDFVITEYGIADCRSKVDEDVIKAMLNIADSRFQSSLLNQAKKAGKIAADYQIPEAFRNNYPQCIDLTLKSLQSKDLFPPYPFGSDLTPDEEVLAQALTFLKKSPKMKLLCISIKSLFFFKSDKPFANYLQRMDLEYPKTLQNVIYKKVIKYILYKYTG